MDSENFFDYVFHELNWKMGFVTSTGGKTITLPIPPAAR